MSIMFLNEPEPRETLPLTKNTIKTIKMLDELKDAAKLKAARLNTCEIDEYALNCWLYCGIDLSEKNNGDGD